MAVNLSTLSIGNESPEVAYFPFVNLEPSQNVTAGWQLQYTGSGVASSPGQIGVGTSYHYTNLNGASFMILWNGTGIDLVGTTSNASYLIALDGQTLPTGSHNATATLLASLDGLEYTNHTLLLTTFITNSNTPNAFLTFADATITYAPPASAANTTATPYTVNDTDIAFMGRWSYVTDGAGSPMHVSTTAGDRAQTTFVGSAVTVYGLVSSFSGRYSVTVDNVTTAMSAQSSYNNSNALLFFATDLSQEAHLLTIVNEENSTLALRVDGVNVTTYGELTSMNLGSSSSASTPAGTIAAVVLAGVLVVLLSAIFYRFCINRRKKSSRPRRSLSLTPRHNTRDEKKHRDPRPVSDISSPAGEEDLESNSLSASKGYGIGLGLRRGFPFAFRKAKRKSNPSSKSSDPSRCEMHPMAIQYDPDDKRLSLSTLAADLPVLSYVPESEKLAPGWTNPTTRTSFASDFLKRRGLLPELRVEDVDGDGEDDAKTLTSRQGEAIAATLCLSPRTSEAPATIHLPPGNEEVDNRQARALGRDGHLLQVRETSPFGLDVAAVFTSLKGKRDSRSTCGSMGSSWSKVRARLYRRAHKDDGKQSPHACPTESSTSSSGPESVPVLMHSSGSEAPPSDLAPLSGTYSFLDFTSSHPSIRSQAKSNTIKTVSSVPAENGHETGTTGRNGGIPVPASKTERSRTNVTSQPTPDAPSTPPGSSDIVSPSDNSNGYSCPSVPTTITQGSAPFPYSVSILPSVHMPHPFNAISLEQSPSPTSTSLSPGVAGGPRARAGASSDAPTSDPHSPTESVPLSVSDIYFRHSFSDSNPLESRRASANSGLPPHPPLPHREDTDSVPTLPAPPPPYIVQRVLGMTSVNVPPSVRLARRQPPFSATTPASHVHPHPRRPGTAPSSATTLGPTSRVTNLQGPRPRPSTSETLTRSSTAPQLPLQGGRAAMRGPR
ncbi:hypothetical protein EDC04DRAFT_1522477 [Pisolithus marmoratus]|nr:hypothetical protein EDC04DRAFT_1522477 [Pisolithus marmoratus]